MYLHEIYTNDLLSYNCIKSFDTCHKAEATWMTIEGRMVYRLFLLSHMDNEEMKQFLANWDYVITDIITEEYTK